MSKYQKGDEFSLGPSLCGRHAPYAQYRDGKLIGMGMAEMGFDPDRHQGREMISLSDVNEQGRQSVEGTFRTNAPGSVSSGSVSNGAVSSRASTPEYRSGWDRIFAQRKPAGAPS